MDLELVTIGPADDHRLDAFHAGIYLDAFAAQREPLDAWRRALRGDAPYALTVRIAGHDLAGASPNIVGGIAYERYPASGCGLLTYACVAPAARGAGLGRRLIDDAVAALTAAGAPLVLGEVDDPTARDGAAADVAWARLTRFQRWGARVLDVPYVQPSLGPGLARDRGLCLIAFGARAPRGVDGAVLATFVRELWAACEGPGAADDPELARVTGAMRGTVALVERTRS